MPIIYEPHSHTCDPPPPSSHRVGTIWQCSYCETYFRSDRKTFGHTWTRLTNYQARKALRLVGIA